MQLPFPSTVPCSCTVIVSRRRCYMAVLRIRPADVVKWMKVLHHSTPVLSWNMYCVLVNTSKRCDKIYFSILRRYFSPLPVCLLLTKFGWNFGHRISPQHSLFEHVFSTWACCYMVQRLGCGGGGVWCSNSERVNRFFSSLKRPYRLRVSPILLFSWCRCSFSA